MMFSRRELLHVTSLGTVATFRLPSGLGASQGSRSARSGNVSSVDDLDTPAMTIDLDIMEKNIRDMANHCRELGIGLQVHIKNHKIPEIAHRQLRAGAVGITCQKLGEAEVMAAAGAGDNILIPYNIVGKPKLVRLSRLCRWVPLTVAVDSTNTARGISEQLSSDGTRVRVVIELDTGGRRCGVQSPRDALALAQQVSKMPSLDLQGVMTYPSRLEAKPFFEETIDLFKKSGLPMNVISGGGTGREAVSKELGCNVTRSGSYLSEGMRRINASTNPPNGVTCAYRMLVTVVSTPTRDRVIFDAGYQAFERRPPNPFGYVVEYPDAYVEGLSTEHGHMNVSKCSHKFTVGDRISVVPLHSGNTINNHREVYAVRKGVIEAVWPVAAGLMYS